MADSGAKTEKRYTKVDQILHAIAAWSGLIIILIAIGIGAFGSFVHSRLKAKDELKLRQLKHNAAQANANRDIEASRERQEAMSLRRTQIAHDLPTHYIPILDDPTPKANPTPELKSTPIKLTKKL